MRVRFGCTPAIGHTYPLLPAGPMPDVLFAVAAERASQDEATEETPAGVGAFFGEVRLDNTADEAIAAARDWACRWPP